MSILKQLILEMDPNKQPFGGISQLDNVNMTKNNPRQNSIPFTRYMMQRSAAEGEEETDPKDFGHIYDIIRDGGLSKEEFIQMMSSEDDSFDDSDDMDELSLFSDPHDDSIDLDKSELDNDPGDHEYR